MDFRSRNEGYYTFCQTMIISITAVLPSQFFGILLISRFVYQLPSSRLSSKMFKLSKYDERNMQNIINGLWFAVVGNLNKSVTIISFHSDPT